MTSPLHSLTDALLEVRLYRASQPGYEVELQFDDPTSQGQHEPVRGPAPLSPPDLSRLQNQPHLYGEALAAALFAHPKVLSTYQLAKAAVELRGGALRISLIIDPSAPELQALAWELLLDPITKMRICTNENTPFSRFLFGRDWAPIPLLRRGKWKSLIAVPDPTNLDDWGFAPIDAQEQIDLAREALGGVSSTGLVKVLDGPVTLDALVDAIEQGVDVLYLVCHGAMRVPDTHTIADDFESGFGEDESITRERSLKLPILYLENEAHEVAPVSAGRLARRLADLSNCPRPRLVVLASCESAGVKGDWSGQTAQASLAPRLARAGIPALVAMQGKVSLDTAKLFMRPFFAELATHGRIDQAMAAARGQVRDRPDSWMPALFLRLKDGRLWYEPSFTPGAKVNFQSIADEIAVGKFTPIVGWGLAEGIYGTKSGLSERLALEKRVPFESHRLGELALVSQYLQLTSRSDTSALNALKERMRAEVLTRFEGRLEGDTSMLSGVLNAAGRLQRQNPNDPYAIVANLPSTVFINASPDGLLEEALKSVGKSPMIRTPHWRCSSTPAAAEILNPTVENPLILHVFGHFADPESLVLGEDDYLDYLMGVAQNQALLSNALKNAIANHALMFLGFHLADWSFRVLFRIVMRLMAGASFRQGGKPNVAVQVEPDNTLFSGAEEARDYLQRFYGPSNIEPFWGTSEDFLTELWPKVKAGLEKRKANAY